MLQKVRYSKLKTVVNLKFLRTIVSAQVGKRRLDRCRSENIRRRLGAKETITNMIKKRRLNWLGHVQRRDLQSYVKTAYKEGFPW